MDANEREYGVDVQLSLLTIRQFIDALTRTVFIFIRVHSRPFAVSFFFLAAPWVVHADPAQDEARAQTLFTEIRCVQCQGQDIADSDAQIAADMRGEIRAAIRAGQSDAQIRQALYDHYGDFVLFRPRFSLANLLLWALPPLVVVAGAGIFLFMRRKPALSDTYDLSEEEQKKLREIMKTTD